jgi:hypothetical protein
MNGAELNERFAEVDRATALVVRLNRMWPGSAYDTGGGNEVKLTVAGVENLGELLADVESFFGH